MPNTAPAGTSLTRTIPRSYTLHKSDFGFNDADGNAFKSVFFTTLPTAGTLYFDANGAVGGGRFAVVAGQTISAADILAGKLTYVAPPGVSGANYDHFAFQVQDDGGNAGGGADTDQGPKTLTFDLVASATPAPMSGYLLDLTGLSATDGVKIQGDVANDGAGWSVSSAGDVNGDGFSDIIVGAWSNDSGGEIAGAAYVIFGKASGFGSVLDLTGLSTANGFKLQGEGAGDVAGWSVSSAGDVNGDGFADIIVGARGNDSGGSTAGAAYVVFGKSTGFGTLIDLTGLAATDGFKIQGERHDDQAGFSVSSAGDVNGDGFADIIVGAPFKDRSGPGGGVYAGTVYVIFGKASGFGSLIDLTGLSAVDGFKIQGGVAERFHEGEVAGRSVSSAGDVNGDGFADIIVGAPANFNDDGYTGAAYVVFGKSSGFGSLIDLTNLSAAQGFKIQGDAADDRAGIVSSGGDVNGDGFADIIVGAYGNDSGGDRAGAAYVIFGKAGGFGNLINVSDLTASEGFKIQGDFAADQAGGSVSSAGDFNGDGFADILVGARSNDSGGSNAGAAYVIYGKAGSFGSLIDLTDLSAAQGFKIQGDAADDNAGRSVSSGGDVNGDGFADIIVGAYGNDSGGYNAGAAYVIFGRATINTNTAPTVSANVGLTLNEGATGTITAALLDYDDAEQADTAITYTITSAATNGTLKLSGSALGLGGTFTQDDINNGRLTYVHNGGETTSGAFGFTVSDGAGGSVTGQSFAFAVNPVDDPATLGNDSGTVAENATAVIAVLANDSDVDSALAVARINGQTIAVGAPVTLASGALVSLNNDGTLTYNPNHAFDATPAAGSGASNVTAADSFTYALAGGGTATVSVTINGIDSNDNLIGTAGNDTLDGGVGSDVMTGGLGNDLYYVDTAGDFVVETSGQGNDRVLAQASYALSAGSEVELLTTSDNLATTVISLTGNNLAQYIYGNAGSNQLDGGGGGDVMVGLGGDDFYIIRHAADRVVEAAGGGYDRVLAAANFTLEAGSEVELLTTIDNLVTTTINLTGNALSQYIYGNAGSNTLDGGGGGDVMVGLGGDDFYIIRNGADRVVETSGGGYDRVLAVANFTLEAGSEVELFTTIDNLATTAINLSGNTLSQYIYGNAGSNQLDGGGGGDVMVGLGGDDFYIIRNAADRVVEASGGGYDWVLAAANFTLEVGSEVELFTTIDNLATTAINLTGNSLSQYISGNAGSNTLDGGGGGDVMVGLGGDDFYTIRNAADRVVEASGGGSDRIFAAASFTLEAGSEVELFTTIDNLATTAINLTGNALSQYIYGNAGSNQLDGGGGGDTMLGLGGDDFYVIRNTADRAVETAGAGSDRVLAETSFALEAGSEIELMTTADSFATAAINLTGNELAQYLYGNAGANMLDGKGGADVMTGFEGADTFAFSRPLGGGNIDRITDFASGVDKIALDHDLFGLGIGPLPASAFVTGSAAADADDRIIYDSTTGALYYDADGNGAGAAVQFATLGGAPALTASDFIVI